MASLEALQQALARALAAPPAQGPQATTESQTPGHEPETCGQHQDGSDPALAGISQDELRRGRQTLLRKRLSQTRSLLPRTTAALAQRYGRLFEAYAKDHHFSGYRAPQLDAVGFSRNLNAHRETPPWIGELARWEALSCRWTLHPNLLALLWLRYDVGGSAAGITWQAEPKKRWSLWIAYRLCGRGAIRRLR